MKINSGTLILAIGFLGCFFTCHESLAAVTIVDTFDQGGFTASIPDFDDWREDVNLPLASRRIVAPKFGGIGSSYTAMDRAIDPVAGQLSSRIIGSTSVPEFPLGLNLTYGSSVLNDISNCTEFILGFSELSGVGTLYVEVGSSLGLDGVFRIDLTGPGELRYPVNGVWANPGHTLDAFSILHFAFEARSEQFSFTLDEIRLVPEPSGAVLLLAAAGGMLVRRRR